MTSFQEDKFIRAADVRQRYSISNPTLHRWIKSGKIPKPQFLNKQRVWKQSALEAAEEKMFDSGENVESNLPGVG